MGTFDEDRLIEKLRLIEALFAGAGTEGERVAAEHARQRILERLTAVAAEDPPVEFKFTLGDMWSRRVFVALLRRYGLRPYRYKRQRYTTVMVKVSKGFVDETLWPQFQRFDDTLREYLSGVTDRVVSQVINEDLSEAAVVSEPQTLAVAREDQPLPRRETSAPRGQGAQGRTSEEGGAGSGKKKPGRKKGRGRRRGKRRR